MAEKAMQLKKKIFIRGKLKALSGLHIGGSDQALSIGGVDNVVVRDPITGKPYVPGSSIKGKTRVLVAKLNGLVTKDGKVFEPDENEEREEAILFGKVFGVSAQNNIGEPTRLIVRDAMLTKESADELERLETDLPYTEVKTEVTINRITSKANPRQMERVPAGAEFEFEMVLNIYEGDNEKALLDMVLEGMELLQDDFLGGSGSRGYGKVKLSVDKLYFKDVDIYKNLQPEKEYTGVEIPKELK